MSSHLAAGTPTSSNLTASTTVAQYSERQRDAERAAIEEGKVEEHVGNRRPSTYTGKNPKVKAEKARMSFSHEYIGTAAEQAAAASYSAELRADAKASVDAAVRALRAGDRIEVHWPLDKAWYPCTIEKVNKKRHEVVYDDDGVRETVDLAVDSWRPVVADKSPPPSKQKEKGGKKGKATPPKVTPPSSNKEVPRPRRSPSAYNLFVQAEIAQMKAADPQLEHKVAFAMAAADWTAQKKVGPEDDDDDEGGGTGAAAPAASASSAKRPAKRPAEGGGSAAKHSKIFFSRGRSEQATPAAAPSPPTTNVAGLQREETLQTPRTAPAAAAPTPNMSAEAAREAAGQLPPGWSKGQREYPSGARSHYTGPDGQHAPSRPQAWQRHRAPKK
jgi:hypothetical protein